MPKKSQPDKSTDVNNWIRAYQDHQDEEAQNNLVLHYKNLIDSIARKYSKGKSYHEDIFQVGIIGLLGAIRRYDESYGKSFEAFAIPTIIGEIKRFLRDKTWSVHVPRRIKELGPKIKTTVEDLTRELQRSPQIHEIANRLEVTEEEVLEAMEMGKSYQALSVDHSIEADADGSTVTLLDIIGNVDEGYEKVNQKLVVEKVLHVLTDRERQIIQHTYLENLSQKETGELLNISQMHVSRLQRRAIKKLQDAIFAEPINTESSTL
ncbi:Sig B/F/G subfamily RNA polymerase sigma-28 subunit [Bacillus freudenreichii]|nr:Sig B/F/G subfamily RNA polymerase sigma-28 subunit [Bacillus freudenreichii]